jgi:hypothetical protein
LHHLRQRPQGLRQALAARRKTIRQVAARKLIVNRPARTNISERVPARDKTAGVKLGHRRTQLVTKTLGSLCEHGRIQGEPAKILNNARRLTGAIEIRIDNPISSTLHNGADYTMRSAH